MVPLYVTVPVTPLFKVKVALEIVDASMFSLNVAVIAAFTATPAALLAGLVDETVGGVVSVVEAPPPPPPQAATAILKSITKANLVVFNFFSLPEFSVYFCAFTE